MILPLSRFSTLVTSDIFVHDNDANIETALEDSGLESVSCAAHNLNLVVTNGIKKSLEFFIPNYKMGS
uniref:Uncharacterized protein n=1 Tax=Romanomermis culicivorax TaxID=13658 RepID=A0A915KA17_ROMCU